MRQFQFLNGWRISKGCESDRIVCLILLLLLVIAFHVTVVCCVPTTCELMSRAISQSLRRCKWGVNRVTWKVGLITNNTVTFLGLFYLFVVFISHLRLLMSRTTIPVHPCRRDQWGIWCSLVPSYIQHLWEPFSVPSNVITVLLQLWKPTIQYQLACHLLRHKFRSLLHWFQELFVWMIWR